MDSFQHGQTDRRVKPIRGGLIFEVKHRKDDEKRIAEQQQAVGPESIYPGKEKTSYRQYQGENRCREIA